MSVLTRAEKRVLRLLNENVPLKQIEEDIYKQFEGQRVPNEYLQAIKRGVYLEQELQRNVKQESYESRNWREQYNAGKAKRH
jgi:hypothetical protein